ncbi:hypothetical protein C8J57DRAFT_1323118, partial [Mycena rebaudengoi]
QFQGTPTAILAMSTLQYAFSLNTLSCFDLLILSLARDLHRRPDSRSAGGTHYIPACRCRAFDAGALHVECDVYGP